MSLEKVLAGVGGIGVLTFVVAWGWAIPIPGRRDWMETMFPIAAGGILVALTCLIIFLVRQWWRMK